MAKSFQGVSVFSFDNIGAAFIDMENGHIDAVLNDWPTTREYLRLKGNAKIVGDILSQEYYGIAVRQGDTDLLEKINYAIGILKESGRLDSIYQKWFKVSN
jgi:polar amino acid transport system substrate-binding protein